MAQTKADKMINQYRYADAARVLKRTVKKNADDGKACEQYAFVLRKLHDFEQSEVYYRRAEMLGDLSNPGLIHFGQVLVKNGKVAEARDKFDRYLIAEPDNFIAKLMAKSLDDVVSWSISPESFTVNPVEKINSSFADFSPIVYDNKLVFATERHIDHVNESSSDWNNAPYLAMYAASFEDNGEELTTKRATPFLSNLNGDYHVGPISIDTVNDKIYFTEVRTFLRKNHTSHLTIYEADLIKGKRIKNETDLFETDTFSFAHPAISSDGKTLVFASNRHGGKGQMDLYYVEKTGAGWGPITPLSNKVNTPLNEVFPYFKNDSTLFFSSDGHPGYGGLDVFASEKINGEWTSPQNLRSPLNSNKDDFGICFLNETKGYFSSARDGGKGKDDIYEFIQKASLTDSQRVQVAGVFEYDQLPPEGVTLTLLDENDNVLEVVQTDSLGNFVFNNLPVNQNYKVRVNSDSEEVKEEGKVYLLNDQGEKALLLDRINESDFVFKTLSRHEMNSMTLMDETDEELGTFDIYGQVFAPLPHDVAGIEMLAVNDDGKIVATALTDSNGYYQFLELEKSEYLTIQPSQKDSVIYQSSAFYSDGTQTRRVISDSSSFFKMAMHIREVKQEPKEVSPSGPLQGFVSYKGEPLKGIPVIVFDSLNQISDVQRTNQEGSFIVNQLAVESHYSILLPDSLDGLAEWAKVFLIDRQSKKIINATAIDARNFVFVTLPEIETSLTPAQAAALNHPLNINGQLYKQLPGDFGEGITIYAYDAEGNLIETVVTDKFGMFEFNKLSPNGSYIIKTDAEDPSSFNMNIFNSEGVAIEEIRLDELQAYLYETLDAEKQSRLSLLSEADEEMSVANLSDLVRGQIYKKLPGDYAEGIKVYAFDEDGNLLDSTYTDGKGNFQFTRLSGREDFTIQVLDENDQQLNVALYDFNGAFRGILGLDTNNSFTYSKIILEAAAELERLDETDTEYKHPHMMFGQIYDEIPGDMHEGLSVYALDDDGNLIDMANLDENGKFAFSRLSPDEHYIFKVGDDDAEFNIVLLDADGNIIDKIAKRDGIWVYDHLPHDSFEFSHLDENDSELGLNEEASSEEIANEEPVRLDSNRLALMYGHRKSGISKEDSAVLQQISASLVRDRNQIIKLNAHSDPSEKAGLRSYSALRSSAIARYLVANDVNLDQISVTNWEDSDPVIDCGYPSPCNEEQRMQNRRVDMQLVSRTAQINDPDYIVRYDFNAWTLDEEAEKIVFRLLKQLEADDNSTIQLDGYTDTWGSFEQNARISELRATNLKNLLIKKGISADRISEVSHGELSPIDQCILEYPCPVEERRNNRRVEIRLLKP